MHLNIFVSQCCFINCRGCYSYSKEEEKGKQISTDIIVRFLEFAHKQGVNKVTLCGGDPLTRNDILELLEKIKSIGFSISMDTLGSSIIKKAISVNRTMIEQTDAKILAELVDEIGIPIDGSNNRIFKKFRQAKSDIIREQLEICQELHKYGANICINTVAHKENLDDAHDLARLIKSMDYINKWQIFQYMALGRFGLKNRRYFEITDEEFSKFQLSVLEEFNSGIDMIQFKSAKSRKNAYMLIDNSGNSWIPSYENMSLSGFSYIVNSDTIVGNIQKEEDWERICSYLDKSIGMHSELQSKLQGYYDNDKRKAFINRISNNGEYSKLFLPMETLKQYENQGGKNLSDIHRDEK